MKRVLFLFFGASLALSIMQPALTVTETWILWLPFLFVFRPIEACFSVQCLLFWGRVFVYSALKCRSASSPISSPSLHHFISPPSTLKHQNVKAAMLSSFAPPLFHPACIRTSYFCITIMSNIKIISLNVKGVGHVVKRQKIISFLKRENAQIALLQETHLTDLEHIRLRRSWVGQVFYSSFSLKSRGVAILIHKKLPFTLEEVIKDDEGRFVIVTVCLYGECNLIGSVYGPNMFEPSFFSRLLAVTSSHFNPLHSIWRRLQLCSGC